MDSAELEDFAGDPANVLNIGSLDVLDKVGWKLSEHTCWGKTSVGKQERNLGIYKTRQKKKGKLKGERSCTVNLKNKILA